MTLSPEQARRLARALLSDDDEPGDARHIPRSIGRYRIVRHIGTGGMGEVYEAEQDNPRRRVALKVIRPDIASPEVLRRFDLESSILAKLQHPGIAQVFDAGKAQGPAGETPYFAMEFVEGRPLLEFAAGLPLRERLALFLRVCEAVEHAHRRGIIHRDLKPANILVEAGGQPRILDFGIARATDADIRATTLQTDIGKLVGTLPYMSPEQAGGDPADLDTRSDVYSLGVILYELLAGKPPYEIKRGLIPEALRIIKEVDPAPLSTTNRTLRGDLETITSKSLAKERERRYQSVSDLAADLRRYLSDQPIEARPPSAMYHLRKFARRNRIAFAAGAFSLMLLPAVALMATVIAVQQRDRIAAAEESARLQSDLRAESQALADRAQRSLTTAHEQKAVADRERQIAQAVAKFLERVLSAPDPRHSGRQVLVIDVLDRATLDLTRVEDPVVANGLRQALGLAYLGLHELTRAEPLLDQARTESEGLFGVDDRRTLDNQLNWCLLLQRQRKYAEVEPVLRENIERRTRVFGRSDWGTLRASEGLAICLIEAGRLDAARTQLEADCDLAIRYLGPRHEQTLRSKGLFADLLISYNQFQQAASMLEEVVSGLEQQLGAQNDAALTARNTLAIAYSRQGKHDQAERVLRELVRQSTEMRGPESPGTLIARGNLAQTIFRQGKVDEAIESLQACIQDSRATTHPDHQMITGFTFNLATYYRKAGKHEASEPLFKEAAEYGTATLPENSPDRGLYSRDYGACLLRLGKAQEAEAWMLDGHNALRGSLGPDHPWSLAAIRALVDLYERTLRTDEAARYKEMLPDSSEKKQ